MRLCVVTFRLSHLGNMKVRSCLGDCATRAMAPGDSHFLPSVGEATVRLQDVDVPLDLQINGRAVTSHPAYDGQSTCCELLD